MKKVVQKMPDPVLIPREEAEKLFSEVSLETCKLMKELALWRERSLRSNFIIGGSG
jgi:hypothetical protein